MRPQTIEAISHAKAAKVPIVVAINKVDKEGAQPERVKQELTEYGLVADDWGGDITMVPVSAIRGENLDTLLEMILTVAEMEDLNANPHRPAKGTVIEAHLDKARGLWQLCWCRTALCEWAILWSQARLWARCGQ